MRISLALIMTVAFAARASAEPEPQPPPTVDPRFSVRRSFGEGVGYQDGYTYVEGFLPFMQQPGSSLYYGGTRIVNYDTSRAWEAQLGGGGRWLLPSVGIVAGVNAFYDGRNTDTNWFNQAGLGWEALGPVWQARGNVYLPVGQQNGFISERSAITGASFVRTNILIDVQRTRQVDTALGGVDVEAGRELPTLIQSLRASAYVGLYSYSNDGVKSANGVRARLEAWVGENASLHLAVQHDPVFNTTVTGGLALHFGGVSRGMRQSDPLAARLGERVVRDPNIVILRHEVSQTGTELALDPATRQPFEVRHVASSAAAGGDGSIERPFRTLGTLQAGSAPGQILFAHAGSIFTAQAITLKTGQRFLGEGVNHFVASSAGTFVLPRATMNASSPTILNPVGAGVTLGSGTEVSGFRIVTTETASPAEISGKGPALAVLVPGDAIYGRDVTDVNVNRNVLDAAGVPIKLEDVGGAVRVADNTITRAGLRGITYTGTAATATLSITGNKVANVDSFVGARGIEVDVSGGARVRGMIVGNDVSRIAGEGASGIALSAGGNAGLTVQVARNTISGGGSGPGLVTGIGVSSSGSASLGLQLFGNASSASYQLAQAGASVFKAEDFLATNVGPFSANVGTILIVPQGMFGFVTP